MKRITIRVVFGLICLAAVAVFIFPFFWIASTSKPLAASAIVALAEKKMLYLDDPASSLFPEFEKKPWPEARSNGLQLYGN
jgi:hypothetical protein